MTAYFFALVIYIALPHGEFTSYIPMADFRSCINAEVGLSMFPNNEQMSMAAYCREIK